MLGAGDAGVEQAAAQQRAGLLGQDQQHLAELRALALVHGHGEGAVVAGQARRGEGAVAGVAFALALAFKKDPQAELAVQADADVAVEQAEGVVVLPHHDRPAGIPAFAAGNLIAPFHPRLQHFVDPGHAPAAFALGAEGAEVVEGGKGSRRIGAFRRGEEGRITAIQAFEQIGGGWLGVPGQIAALFLQQAQGGGHFAVVDPSRQLADAAVAGEAVAVGQQHHGIAQA
ncbi:hypothetical protein D3C85_1188420 [compost metagenome]